MRTGIRITRKSELERTAEDRLRHIIIFDNMRRMEKDKYDVIWKRKVDKQIAKMPAKNAGQILRAHFRHQKDRSHTDGVAELFRAWQGTVSLPHRLQLGGVLDMQEEYRRRGGVLCWQ